MTNIQFPDDDEIAKLASQAFLIGVIVVVLVSFCFGFLFGIACQQ